MDKDTVFGNLQGSFDKPLEALTKESRDIATAYIPDWQVLSREQRITKAEQVDKLRVDESKARFEKAERELHAPSRNQIEDKYWWDLRALIGDKERELAKWDAMPEPLPSEAHIKEQKLIALRDELGALEAQYKAPYPATLTALAQTKLEPVMTANAGGEKPAEMNWQLVPPPKRLPGYRWELYRCLEKMHKDGKRRPTAHDVLSEWVATSPTKDLSVSKVGHRMELHYHIKKGTQKTADLKTVQAAIDKLILSI